MDSDQEIGELRAEGFLTNFEGFVAVMEVKTNADILFRAQIIAGLVRGLKSLMRRGYVSATIRYGNPTERDQEAIEICREWLKEHDFEFDLVRKVDETLFEVKFY